MIIVGIQNKKTILFPFSMKKYTTFAIPKIERLCQR